MKMKARTAVGPLCDSGPELLLIGRKGENNARIVDVIND